MANFTFKCAFGAFILFCASARATSTTHVCAQELALFVFQEARTYTRTVIFNNSRSRAIRAGIDPEVFSRLYSADDILQDIEMEFLKGQGFDPGYHGDKETLELNNHLKTWIKVAVNRRIGTLVNHTREANVRELRELPRKRTESGGWVELDVVDSRLPRTVLDLVAERQEQGDRVASDFSSVEPETGITPAQWTALLKLGPRWVEAACEAQDTPLQLFWAHKRGLYTATDFAEELLEQTLRWVKAKPGSLDSASTLNAIAEITAQKMVEELTGTLEVRERALSWMRQSGAKARNASAAYTLFYVEGASAEEVMVREGLDKATVSLRKKTAQRTYFQFANALLQYPPVLDFPSLETQLADDDYLRVIEGIEAELGQTATAEKRRLAFAEVRKTLYEHVTIEGKLKQKKAEFSTTLKSAVAKALTGLSAKRPAAR